MDKSKVIESMKKYLLRAYEYEILESPYECDYGRYEIVAKDDDGGLHFIDLKVSDDIESGIEKDFVDMEKAEKISACYLIEKETGNCKIHFDVLSVLLLNEGRAFVRYHLNAFGGEVCE